MSRVSTHVIDVTLGKPAQNIAVRLERREPTGAWVPLISSHTAADGRCGQLLPSHDTFAPGTYRLHFDTGSYFHAQQVVSLYPFVEVTFQVADGQSEFHIPLLLSPHGYTTYRGS
jgi:5-hydroxyisourate hydrolase